MSAWTKEDYEKRERAALRAFSAVVEKLGKKHPMIDLMGTLAWGRHHFERGPSQQGLKDVVYTAGALAGMYDVLNRWALLNDREAQRILIDAWAAEMHSTH